MTDPTELAQATLQLMQAAKLVADVQLTTANAQKAIAETQAQIAVTQKALAVGAEKLLLEGLGARVPDIVGLPSDNGVASEFPHFLRLPAELRVAIWTMALPPGKIYEVFEDTVDERLRFQRPSRPPNIRGACKEARQVTEANGFWALDYMWFNKSRDILFFNESFPWSDLPPFRDYFPKGGIVAVDAWVMRKEKGLLVRLKDCDTIIAAFRYGEGANSNLAGAEVPRFYTLRDDDPTTLRFRLYSPSDHQTWKEFREELVNGWLTYAAENGFSLDCVPTIMGVEVLRSVKPDPAVWFFETRKAR